MNRSVLTLVPIMLGGIAGALVGLFEAFPKAPATRAEAAAAVPRASANRPAAPAAPAAPANGLAAAPGEPSAAPAASIAVTPSASPAASAAPARRAFDLSEPTTAENLLSAQVQCNRSSPEDCERAAFGLDSGKLGTKDVVRARSLRRIALTLYVKQCETGRALACARLAEMYDAGDIVQANPRNAQALRTRVSELCAQRGATEPGCAP